MPERRLSGQQRYLLESVRATGARRADKCIEKARLSSLQRDAFDRALARLEEDAVRVVINTDLRKTHAGFNASIMESLLSLPRLLNRFEIEQAQQNTTSPNMVSRIMEEFLLYGGTPDIIPVLSLLPAAARPHYGALDFIGNPRTLPMLAFYGPYRFRLKKDVQYRCTFTAGAIPMVPSESVYTWEHIRGVIIRKFSSPKPAKYLFEYVNDTAEPVESDNSLRYIEAQILGGVDLLHDVDRLYYPVADRYTKFFGAMERLAQMCEIELVAY